MILQQGEHSTSENDQFSPKSLHIKIQEWSDLSSIFFCYENVLLFHDEA